MTINFRDFGRLPVSHSQPFSQSPSYAHLADLNDWVKANNIDVINCETLVSNLNDRHAEAIRVWYRE